MTHPKHACPRPHARTAAVSLLLAVGACRAAPDPAPSRAPAVVSSPVPHYDAGAAGAVAPAGAAAAAVPALDAAVGGMSGTDAGVSEPPSDRTWRAAPPRKLGMLAGFEASYATPDVQVYGSDMAASFEHAGQVVMLFGDTYAAPDSACDTRLGENDDMVATLPLPYDGGLPKLQVLTEPTSATTFRRVSLRHEQSAIVLDEFKVPIAGFSDGSSAFALFQPQQPVGCDVDSELASGGCPLQDGVQCLPNIASCQPAGVSVPVLCEPQQPICLLGGCPRSAACVDTLSSEYDGSPRGEAAAVLSTVYIGKAHADDLTAFDAIATWRTNKFSHPAARTVRHFSAATSGADYSPGHGDLLLWGRPGIYGEQGREARLYFATARLPLEESNGELHARYFAGLDDATGEPRWSDDAGAAVPLAMDGLPSGDPHEPQAIVGTTTVSWLGAPIQRWLMMYGGDLPSSLLGDPFVTHRSVNAGAIVMRLAEHPWGPWSPALVHLPAGSPNNIGDAYGPGGIMFHASCVDQPGARCARSDPYSLDLTGLCVMRPAPDPGRLYAPAIIDAYTRNNAQGGLDVTWAISTWLPYATYLMQTSFYPD